MLWNDFDVAMAQICFLQNYVKEMKAVMNMNAKHEPKRAEAEARRDAWPKHRRFWHRRAPAPAPAPAKPASGSAFRANASVDSRRG